MPFFTQNCFHTKLFVRQTFFTQNFFYTKLFVRQTFFTQNFFYAKFFVRHTFFTENFFTPKNHFTSKIIFTRKSFLHQKPFLRQFFFEISNWYNRLHALQPAAATIVEDSKRNTLLENNKIYHFCQVQFRKLKLHFENKFLASSMSHRKVHGHWKSFCEIIKMKKTEKWKKTEKKLKKKWKKQKNWKVKKNKKK